MIGLNNSISIEWSSEKIWVTDIILSSNKF